jgi:hypothetical protein
VIEEAQRAGCTGVELNSAVHRAEAHRFYFRQRMHVIAFHFALKVPGSRPKGLGPR